MTNEKQTSAMTEAQIRAEVARKLEAQTVTEARDMSVQHGIDSDPIAEVLRRVKSEAWQVAQQAATSTAKEILDARKASREGLEDDPKRSRKFVPFWERQETEYALRELDVWASVFKAGAEHAGGCPKFSTIFEAPRKGEPGYWYDDRKIKILPNEGEEAVIEDMVKVSTAKVEAPERIMCWSVETALKRRDLLVHREALLLYFARTGPFKGIDEIDPGDMDFIGQAIITAAVNAITASWRKVAKR